MELITAEILNGAGVVGLCVAFVLAVGRGWIVTARENNAIKADRDSLREENKELLHQNSELMEMARLGQATFNALRAGAEQ